MVVVSSCSTTAGPGRRIPRRSSLRRNTVQRRNSASPSNSSFRLPCSGGGASFATRRRSIRRLWKPRLGYGTDAEHAQVDDLRGLVMRRVGIQPFVQPVEIAHRIPQRGRVELAPPPPGQ